MPKELFICKVKLPITEKDQYEDKYFETNTKHMEKRGEYPGGEYTIATMIYITCNTIRFETKSFYLATEDYEKDFLESGHEKKGYLLTTSKFHGTKIKGKKLRALWKVISWK